MIVRIVKMHFKPGHTKEFLEYFKTIKSQIEAMPGLVRLKLYEDASNPNILFTHSTWLNESYLNKYRNSELFAEVWPQTKALFQEKAEAWSLTLK